MKNIMWLASYPKSGNTWFRMFLSNYQKDSTNPVPLENIEKTILSSNSIEFEAAIGLNPFELLPDEVDLYRPDMYRYFSEELSKTQTIGFRKTHDAYILNKDGEPLFPEDVSLGAVYFVRNPLDVCISFANHNAENINNTLTMFLNNNTALSGKTTGQLRQLLKTWQGHVLSWNQQTKIPVHTVRYEDMIRTPMETFGSIIRFIDLPYDENRLERAIANSSFNILKQMESEKGFIERSQDCKQFFWKGKIGNYLDYLNEDQIEQIIKHNDQAMKRYGYLNEKGELTI